MMQVEQQYSEPLEGQEEEQVGVGRDVETELVNYPRIK